MNLQRHARPELLLVAEAFTWPMRSMYWAQDTYVHQLLTVELSWALPTEGFQAARAHNKKLLFKSPHSNSAFFLQLQGP